MERAYNFLDFIQEKDNYPVALVTWDDAKAYAEWG